MDRLKNLKEKALSLPLTPGVYLMKDKKGDVIYVGKSRKLKNRVLSYFHNPEQTPKTARMVSHIADFDYILCDGEMEALTLENTLIKQYTPHYNIRLKDAKSYPYIKVTGGEYPKIFTTRERKHDGAKYFGPYVSSAAAHDVVDTVTKMFAIPTCKRSFPKDIGKERPCLYYQMGRCVAPCIGKISKEEYRHLIRMAEGVLAGGSKETETALTAAMLQAAEKEQFELAARYRDAIENLKRLSDKQKVVGEETENRDVLALYTDDLCGVLSALCIRGGKLVGKQEYLFSAASLTDAEDAGWAVIAYYETVCDIPKEVLLDFPIEEEEYALLGEYLTELAKHKVTVRTPKRGDLKKLSQMALANAKERAKRYREEGEKEDATLVTLASLLGLSFIPKRIEAYDISEIGKEHITAAMVVSDGTSLKKKDYRTFRMKTIFAPDDYASMKETLSRRLSHIGDGSLSLGEKPDLILLDGGVGQVHAVKEVMDAMGLSIPLFGMVKDDFHKTRALTDGERELSIAQHQSVYTFIYKLQEEVHRVAVKATMGAKEKTLRRSVLENIPGIGPKKAKTIRQKMSLSQLKTSTKAEMVARGISPGDAQKIETYYQNAGRNTP